MKYIRWTSKKSTPSTPNVSVKEEHPTHWRMNKKANIVQTFSWMNIAVFFIQISLKLVLMGMAGIKPIHVLVLTHCGLVMPNSNQAITWTNVNLWTMEFCGTHLRLNSQVLKISIRKMILKNILVKLLWHLSGANELMARRQTSYNLNQRWHICLARPQ